MLPIIDTFIPPYEAWATRMPTLEEMQEIHSKTGRFSTHINDRLIARVTNPWEAAHHIAMVGADGGLGKVCKTPADAEVVL